jgi:hypothetical protein
MSHQWDGPRRTMDGWRDVRWKLRRIAEALASVIPDWIYAPRIETMIAARDGREKGMYENLETNIEDMRDRSPVINIE